MSSNTPKKKSNPVGRPRADGRSHLTKIDVFRTAAKLMSVYGFTGTSVRMIAQELDCSNASIFNLFPTKKDLFDELISFVTAAAFRFYEALSEHDLTPPEAIFKCLYEDGKALNSAPVELIAIYALPELRHPDFGHARSMRSKLVTHYDLIIAQGIEDGDFVECDARWAAEQLIQLLETCILAGTQLTRATIEQRSLETARFGLRGLLKDTSLLASVEETCLAIDTTYIQGKLA